MEQDAKRKKNLAYAAEVRRQMEIDAQRKKVSGVMSEHERKLNAAFLAKYQQQQEQQQPQYGFPQQNFQQQYNQNPTQQQPQYNQYPTQQQPQYNQYPTQQQKFMGSPAKSEYSDYGYSKVSSHEHQQAAYNMQNSIQGARNVPGLNLGGGMVDGKLSHSRSNSRSSLGLAAAKNFF